MQAVKKALAASNFSQKKASHNILNDFSEEDGANEN